MSDRTFVTACLVPLAVFALAFLALPLVRLVQASFESEAGWHIYLQILQTPRYLETLVNTVLVSLAVSLAALALATTAGLFL
ncbi:MAG: ABC transporter permease, partial [Pseudomonadota bacterium]|nr:ABC transporter permease [Pseudomonadota bacterium]